MDMGIRQGRGMAWLAAAGVALIAASLVLVTWNSVRTQRMLVMRHMTLSAGVILRSAQARLIRRLGPGHVPRHHAGSGRPMRSMGPELLAQELLADITEDGDVRFLAVMLPDGEVLGRSVQDGYALPELPAEAREVFRRPGGPRHWQALMEQNGERLLVLTLPARRGMARFCMPVQGGGPDDPVHCAPGFQPTPPLMLIGLSAEEHLAAADAFTRTATYQTGFVIAAAAMLMGLTTAWLRRRDQAAAYSALKRFHSRLLDDMPDGLLAVDAGGVVSAANPAAHAILDLPEGGLVGARWDELLPQAVHGGVDQWITLERSGKQLEVLRRPVGGPEGEAQGESLLLVRDRTRLRSLESRLAESEKLAALGRLAAGVAHEIRNPLSALRGFAQFFAKRFQDRQPEAEYARTMVSEADRLDRVVSDMLLLARPQAVSPRQVDAAEALAELATLIDMDVRAKRVELKVDGHGVGVWADPDALRQVLLNLALNSLEALPDKDGRIEIAARSVDGGTEISVTDNGHGFGEEERKRALEPFFTSRLNGTGLGLAIVDKLLRDHGGRLMIDSAVGQGAVVRAFFPTAPSV